MKLTEHNEKILNRFSDMVMQRMEELENTQQQGWFSMAHCGLPINIEGKQFYGANITMLLLDATINHYEYPIYCTIKQANREHAHIIKGSKSMPIVFWEFTVTTPEGKQLSYDEYKVLDRPEREQCTATTTLKSFNVFNISQTNFAEVQPDKYKELTKIFDTTVHMDQKGMYANTKIDAVVNQQSWSCPVMFDNNMGTAHYYDNTDCILIAPKAEYKKHRRKADAFADGYVFYTDLLEQMVISSGVKSRLGRLGHGPYTEDKYGKEALICELTTAAVAVEQGFCATSSMCMQAWKVALKEQPTYILAVLSEVARTVKYISTWFGSCK